MYTATFIDNTWTVRDPALDTRTYIGDPDAAIEEARNLNWISDRESCWMFSLNTKHHVISADLVSIGSVDHTFMVPRDIFSIALKNSASAIMLFHNHPSGEAEPSRDDERITKRIADAGRLIGIEVLDHFVVGFPNTNSWTSLARRGIL